MPTKFGGLEQPVLFLPHGNDPMLFQAAMVCLIGLSVSVLIAHAIDAFRT
jgi:hypothetical protein